jgi:hypothetical protein
MTKTRKTAPLLFVSLVVVGAAVCADGSTSPATARTIAPSVVVMEFPAHLGAMQRPPVEFEHALHVAALEPEGCRACHPSDEQGGFVPGLKGTLGFDDRDELINAFHSSCIDCHEQRSESALKSGPLSCGGCHVRRPPGISARAAMRFDYSLHARHAIAAEEKCETCHHVWDEASGKLRYEKGAEESCRTCHGAVDVGRNFSLANASHRSCVSCHLERSAAAAKGGPTRCVGCHEAEQQATWAQLEEVPRLKRGQPDITWVHHVEARYPAVAFDHLGHEGVTPFCSDCHHQTLKGCDSCHTLGGSEEGAGVTLVQAHHGPDSAYGCVGCHRAAAERRQCSGCHHALAAAPSERSCIICHAGPATAEGVLETPPALAEQAHDPLPDFSDDFPETVVIDAIAGDFEPSKLPHGKIVKALDAAARKSPLAVRFHDGSGTLCAGCHHHSPIGTRPPPCRSCHADSAEPMSDHPGLKVAYHRQCIGCHIEMAIPEQSCTACHALKEVQP